MTSISQYRLLHTSSSDLPTSVESFDLLAPPGTDLWRKPPVSEDDNAPSLVTTVGLRAFRAAEVTITGTFSRMWDQGGLVLILPNPDGGKPAWVKAGVEFKHARYNLSTVANSFLSTSDWSMMPLEETTVRVRVEREVHEGWLTPSLWVYLMRNNGEKQELREVTWFFSNAMSDDSPQELMIGVYAARPLKKGADDTEEIKVHFTGLKVEITEAK